jgi:hypothetical protein
LTYSISFPGLLPNFKEKSRRKSGGDMEENGAKCRAVAEVIPTKCQEFKV